MIFKTILGNAEPYALNLDSRPLSITVRAQVIASFVLFALGKGGLFITSFLFAMAWLEDVYLPYAIVCAVATLAAMAVGYVAAFGRIEARFDLENRQILLTKRAPFYRITQAVPMADYQGIEMQAKDDGVYTLVLVHGDAALNAPLSHRRTHEPPLDDALAYGAALDVKVFNPVGLRFGAPAP